MVCDKKSSNVKIQFDVTAINNDNNIANLESAYNDPRFADGGINDVSGEFFKSLLKQYGGNLDTQTLKSKLGDLFNILYTVQDSNGKYIYPNGGSPIKFIKK